MNMVSIIIPTWNRRRPLHRAIDSCLAVPGLAVEVIVVDDGSTDDTRESLAMRFGPEGRSCGVEGHRVVWRSQANAGACTARNLGLEMATGEFIKFLDSDDWLLPDVLPQEVARMRERDVDVVVTGWEELHAGPTGETVRVELASPRMDAGIDDMLAGRAPITTGALYATSFIRHLRWDPSYRKAQDWQWAWTVALAGARFHSMAAVSYVHDCRGDDRIGKDSEALDMSVDARRRILLWVESRLVELDALTLQRRHALADYHYKDRLTSCRRSRSEWRALWQHLEALDDTRLPPEPIRFIRFAASVLGRYRAVVVYDAIKKTLGR